MDSKSIFRNVNPLQAAHIVQPRPQPGAEHLDVVLIFGPNQDRTLLQQCVAAVKARGLKAQLLGDADLPVQPSELENLRKSGQLGPQTHVFIVGDGSWKTGHEIDIVAQSKPTVDLIAELRTPLEGAPPWNGHLHLLACEAETVIQQIPPGSGLWKTGPILIYGGSTPRPRELPSEELPAAIDFIGQCKANGQAFSGEEAFAYLANWTGECISYLGGDLAAPMTVHAPKTPQDLAPGSVEAELRKRETHDKLDAQAGKSRVTGARKDLQRTFAGKKPPTANPLRPATAIMVQAERGKPENVAALLKAHPELLNARDRGGRTPLIWASLGGNVEVIKVLLDHGADVEAVDRRGRRALTVAKNVDTYAVLTMPREATKETAVGAQPAKPQPRPETPVQPQNTAEPPSAAGFMELAKSGTPQEVAAALKEHPEMLESTDYLGRTPVMWACIGGNVAAAQVLLEAGANVNAKSRAWSTPLAFAYEQKDVEMIRLLCRHGADVNAQSNTGGAIYALAQANKALNPEVWLAISEGKSGTKARL